MTASSVSDEEWLRVWYRVGCSPMAMAAATSTDVRNIYRRRNRLEAAGLDLSSVRIDGQKMGAEPRAYEKRAALEVQDGTVVVFSDAHWWPGRDLTAANTALLRVIRSLRPAAVIANGDVLDAPSISRHDPDGWQNLPTIVDELDEVKVRLAEIARAAGGATLLRTIGNHDLRFDRRLATRVPDFKHLAGMRLTDHIPTWRESWSIEINGRVIVKHRWHNGVHGAYNNVLKGGRSIVTGHLHRLLMTPFTDYNGRRWGVDCGTLAEIGGPQFDYAEDAPSNWGSGFVVLTFRAGELLPPEFCEVIRGTAYFRGKAVHEDPKRASAGGGFRAGRNESGGGRDVPDGVGNGGRNARPNPPAKPRVAARAADAAQRPRMAGPRA